MYIWRMWVLLSITFALPLLGGSEVGPDCKAMGPIWIAYQWHQVWLLYWQWALTHWGWNKMTRILKQFPRAFSIITIGVFWFKFHRNLFLGIQTTINNIGCDNGLAPHRRQAMTVTNDDSVHWYSFVLVYMPTVRPKNYVPFEVCTFYCGLLPADFTHIFPEKRHWRIWVSTSGCSKSTTEQHNRSCYVMWYTSHHKLCNNVMFNSELQGGKLHRRTEFSTTYNFTRFCYPTLHTDFVILVTKSFSSRDGNRWQGFIV